MSRRAAVLSLIIAIAVLGFVLWNDSRLESPSHSPDVPKDFS